MTPPVDDSFQILTMTSPLQDVSLAERSSVRDSMIQQGVLEDQCKMNLNNIR